MKGGAESHTYKASAQQSAKSIMCVGIAKIPDRPAKVNGSPSKLKEVAQGESQFSRKQHQMNVKPMAMESILGPSQLRGTQFAGESPSSPNLSSVQLNHDEYLSRDHRCQSSKNAAPGNRGKSSLGTESRTALSRARSNHHTLDSSNSDGGSMTRHEIENKNFSKSFYRIHQAGNAFEKIPHESVKLRKETPYNEGAIVLDRSEVYSHLDDSKLMGRKGKKNKRGSHTSAKKSKRKKKESGNPSAAVLPEAGIPMNLNAFNQSVFGIVRPFNPQSSVFNPQLDHQMHRKYRQLGPSQGNQSGIMRNANSIQTVQQQQSPQKEFAAQIRRNSASKKDILSCLEIQRLESNRKKEALVPNSLAQVQDAIARKPQTSIGIQRHKKGMQQEYSLAQIRSSAEIASQSMRSKLDSQFQEFKDRFVLMQNGFTKMLGDTPSSEASSDQKRYINVYSNLSSFPKQSISPDHSSNVAADGTKFMKNLLQQSVSDKEMKLQNMLSQHKDRTSKQEQESSQNPLKMSNLLRSRQEQPSATFQSKHTLNSNSIDRGDGESQPYMMFTATNALQQSPPTNANSQYTQDILNMIKHTGSQEITRGGLRNNQGPFPLRSQEGAGSKQSTHDSVEMGSSQRRRASIDKRPVHKTPQHSNRSFNQNQYSKEAKNMFLSYFDRKKLQEEQRNILEMSTNQLYPPGKQFRKNAGFGKSSQNYPAGRVLPSCYDHEQIPLVSQLNFIKLGDQTASNSPPNNEARPIHTSKKNSISDTRHLKGFASPVTKKLQKYGSERDEPLMLSKDRQIMHMNENAQRAAQRKFMQPNISVQGKCLSKSSTLNNQEQELEENIMAAIRGDKDSQKYQQGLYQPVLQRHRTANPSQSSAPAQQPYPANQYHGRLHNRVFYDQKSSINSQPPQVLNPTGQVCPRKSKIFQLNFLQQEKRSPRKIGGKKHSQKQMFENPHKQHKINQVISLANEFLYETFLRPNDQPVNIDRVKYICCHFFGVKLPRGALNEPSLVKSKDFQIFAKEKILFRIYDVINQENQVPPERIQAAQQLLIKKFHVGKGNNYPLVRSILKQRWWWQLFQEGEDFEQANFIWTSWRKNELLDYLQPFGQKSDIYHDGKLRLYNRLEDNFHLSNKKALFFNMTQYYKQLGTDPFRVLPLTFHIEHGIKDPELAHFKQHFQLIEDQRKLKSAELERKKREYIGSKKRKEGYGSESDGWGSVGEEEEEEYLAELGDDVEAYFGVRVPRNVWILKPGENSNRGNGITVVSTVKEVIEEICSSEKRDHTHIIQRYIERPLLINNRKFDIRCYGMFTSVNGVTKGYFYEDGYIRTSCKEFDLEDLGNRFIHLTNDAVQKKSEDYGKFESGNKISYQNFQKYIDTHLPAEKKVNFHRDLLTQIRCIVADTFKATFMKLDPRRLCDSFEIFGYDFMIDENMRVYLIEANTNPCLELSCPLLARIIPAMLDSAFRIALDPLFPPRSEATAAKKNANTLPEMLPINKFELVFDERLEGTQLRELLKNQDVFNLKIDVNEEAGDGEEEEDGQDTMEDTLEQTIKLNRESLGEEECS